MRLSEFVSARARPGLILANFHFFKNGEVFKEFNSLNSTALKHFSIVLHRGAISVGDGLTLLLKYDAKLFAEPIQFQFCVYNILYFVLEHVHITTCPQFRQCATSSTDCGIHMHESKMRKSVYKFIQLRSAPLSCKKRGDIVCELENASRNRCDATRWRDDFSDQAHSTQRQAMRMHLHIVHVCYTQFQKNQTSGKLSTSSSKIIQSQQKLEKIPF